jgi:selenocysteine-specific elongation factor
LVPADKEAKPASGDSAAPSLVLGTAGHIDHGKTSLVRALTGTDTDRLPEEKARGITIDLGFAVLDLGNSSRAKGSTQAEGSSSAEGSLKVAVVDVPGHEKLVRTMVSGAAGIDLVLLVVAADEGVMPQTREHVAICDLLQIENGVVALTKADLADEEVLELAGEEVQDLLAPTCLADAPMVGVSSETGVGLDTLRDTLREMIRTTQPRTPRLGPGRLAIDRVFAMKGFGTVVTGTLLGGEFRVGDTMEIHPKGLRARIRGLQSHGEARNHLGPGARCAVNLQGIEVGEISRGDVVAKADALASTATADVELGWLEGAPETEGTISIEFLTGTAERRGRLAPIGCEGFSPGERAFARLHIDGDPVPLLPGDRFIARGFARTEGAGGTLGGGVILDVAPPHRRRSDPKLLRELEIFREGVIGDGIRERVFRTGMSGAREGDLALEMGLSKNELAEYLDKLAEADSLVAAKGQLWLATDVVTRMEETLMSALDAFHLAEPLRPGMSLGALRGQLPENVQPEGAELALHRLADRDLIAIEGEFGRRTDHVPTLDASSQEAVATIREDAVRAGLEPLSAKDWAQRLGMDQGLFRDLIAYLERGDEIVRAPGDLFFDAGAIASLKERVVEHLNEHNELDTKTYKEVIGTSRRTAMPLMELLDDLHVTRRMGDVRVLRKG